MSLAERNQKRKELYATDPEFRRKCLEAGKRYHAKKRATDVDELNVRPVVWN